MPELTFAVETVASVRRDGFDDLMALHWEEAGDGETLAPDWGHYLFLERKGILRIVAARCAGALVGYQVFFVNPSMHGGGLVAVNDVLYLDPEHRKGMNGVRMIRFSEALLRGQGVRRVICNMPLHVYLGHGKAHGRVGNLMERLGYAHIENVYAKTM